MLRHPLTLSLCACLLTAAAADGGVPQEVQQQTIRISTGASDTGPMPMLPPGREPRPAPAVSRAACSRPTPDRSLRRAQVRISGPDIGTKTALTDAQGRYEFKDLPAGRFNVSVSKSGFVTMQYGQNRPFEPGRPIELADAQIDRQGGRGAAARQRARRTRRRRVRRGGRRRRRHRDAACSITNGRRRLVPAGRNALDERSRPVPDLRPAAGRVLRQRDAAQHEHDGDGHARRQRGGGPTGSNQNSGYAATYYPSHAESRRGAARRASPSARSCPASTSSSSR